MENAQQQSDDLALNLSSISVPDQFEPLPFFNYDLFQENRRNILFKNVLFYLILKQNVCLHFRY